MPPLSLFGRRIRFFGAPVSLAAALHQPFGNHIAADGAEIVEIIGDDKVHLAFGVNAVLFKGFHNFFQHDELFLALRGERFGGRPRRVRLPATFRPSFRG